MARIPIRKVRSAMKRSEKVFSRDEVYRAVMRRAPRLQCVLWDDDYWAISEAAWRTFLEYSQVDKKRYRRDRFDCTEFAKALVGEIALKFDNNGLGIVGDYSAAHAYCCALVNTNGTLDVVFVEPQSDGFRVGKTPLHRHECGVVLF